MFWTRLISGVVLLVILLFTICISGPILYLFLLFISVIGMFELYRATNVRARRENVLTIVSYIGATIYYALVYLDMEDYLLIVLVGAMIALLFVYVFLFPKYHANEIMTAFFGIVYVAVCLSFIYRTRQLPDGEYSVWLIIICSWGCDTMAYVFGILFGKHKMVPNLSPKKTVEGAVGGVISTAVIGGIYAFCVGEYLEAKGNQVLIYALICAVGAMISMVGDLAASAIKRDHDIKDYGKLIPGHGGILDRFDSVIITAPIIYLLAYSFQ